MAFLRSFLSGIFQGASTLLHSPALCIRTSTFIGCLVERQSTGHYSSPFLYFKVIHYLYIWCCFARAHHLSYYLAQKGNLESLLPYDPIGSLTASKYPGFVNQYGIAVLGLLPLFAFYNDYAFFFNLEDTLLQLDSDLLIQNVQQCATAEGTVGRFALFSRRFWSFLRRQTESHVHFTGPPLTTFPNLSKRQRFRLVQQAIISETVTWVGNVFLGTYGCVVL